MTTPFTPEQQAAQPLRFRLLGGLSVEQGDRSLAAPPARTHALLAMLLLEPRAHPRTRLAERLRPDLSERIARQRLNSTLWLLRRGLPELPLQVDDETVHLQREARWLDVEELRGNVASESLAARRAALDLYHDQLLPGLSLPWLDSVREAVHSEYVALARQVATELQEAGSVDAAIAVLQRLCEHETVDEEPLRQLISAAVTAGRPSVALSTFDRHAERLARDGLAPEPATLSRIEELRGPFAHADAGRTHDPPEGAGDAAAPGDPAPSATTAPSAATVAAAGRVDEHRRALAASSPRLSLVQAPRRFEGWCGEVVAALAVGDVDAADQRLAAVATPTAMLERARLAREDARLEDARAHAERAAQHLDDDPSMQAQLLLEQAARASARGAGHRALASAGEAVARASDARVGAAMLDEVLLRSDLVLIGEHVRCGRPASALAQVSATEERARAIGRLDLAWECAHLRAQALLQSGDLRAARQAAEQAVRDARADARGDLVERALLGVAEAYRRAGATEQADAALREALGATTATPSRGRQLAAALVQLALAVDAPEDQPIPPLLACDPAVRRRGAADPASEPRLLRLQGLLDQRRGRHERACRALHGAARAHRERGEEHQVAATEAARALSLLALERWEEARVAARSAGELLDDQLLPADVEPEVRATRAQVALAHDRTDVARSEVSAGRARLLASAATLDDPEAEERVLGRDRSSRTLRRLARRLALREPVAEGLAAAPGGRLAAGGG